MHRQYFHFTIGPVQGFVAQARRTRDFWAGSFLLSWLAGVAMKAVSKQCSGEEMGIVFPKPDEELLEWWEGKEGDGPRQGTIPNRFMARVDGAAFDPQIVIDSVLMAWWGLAERVWEADLNRKPGIGPGQRAIWNRQIDGFWETSWALTDSQDNPNILDRRKNWRTRCPPAEPGVSCMVMDGFQELSGVERPGRDVTEFWGQRRKQLATDLREGECLCAIAFVKRRFVECFGDLRMEMPGDWMLTGWRGLSRNVPSTTFMAATPWLARVVRKSDGALLLGFHEAAKALAKHGEWNARIKRIEEAVRYAQQTCPDYKDAIRQLVQLDGPVFYDNLLDNRRLFKNYTPERPDEMRKRADEVRERLKDLMEIAEGGPLPFYAVLAMDGDNLGQKMGKEKNQEGVASALDEFTRTVTEKLVTDHHGFLVYAGGDDVLAVLAAQDALACAVAIREKYKECFEKQEEEEVRESTISAAVHFVHIQRPLTRVLGETHDLLEEVAKRRTGRDSLAVRLTRPGGVSFEWSMPWKIALTEEKDDQGRRHLKVERLARTLRPEPQPTPDEHNEADAAERFSHGFFHRIRRHLELLSAGDETVLTESEAKAILATDYLNSGVHAPGRRPTFEEAVRAVEPLLEQSRHMTRDSETGEIPELPEDQLGKVTDDAAMLVRFLASTMTGGES